MQSMETYPKAAMERTMKVQEVILRAMAKKITWWQAAEIIGITLTTAAGSFAMSSSRRLAITLPVQLLGLIVRVNLSKA